MARRFIALKHLVQWGVPDKCWTHWWSDLWQTESIVTTARYESSPSVLNSGIVKYQTSVVKFLQVVKVAFTALTLFIGRQEGHLACKRIWGDGVGGHWLDRMEWRPVGWSICLPLLISPCTVKSRSSLLAPADPGGPGKKTVKRLWCGGGGGVVKF